ncbi:substrate-binding periplasmic protein [Noviherbaspirillum galbum]|uniref:Amino acid ABC transporter substrate-binding protein n=1 Tax=Noviherbaspirillum galbum TaxID=2709383 RepID=A0A6B3ST46_9BURK|nr:transporter substrate-binding domain-containing protein [Noviherbaspirillum galbum]NEX62006.1 amino acid ABC transporter substrate-binding protein [Noviherbaspirillum galbum]
MAFNMTAGLAMTLSILATGAAQAKEVNMIFGLALPPYVIQETNSGFELDIIKAALAVKGHTLKPTYASFLALPKLLKEKQADAAQRGNPDLKEADGFFYAAEPTVIYQDNAITLKKNNLKVDSLADLKGKSIVTFQGANQFLGPEFAAAVKGNPNYAENGNERRKLQMLYSGSAQVYAGDVNIFRYYRDSVKNDVDIKQEVVYHKIFPVHEDMTHNAVFLDRQVRDDFNAGLKQLKGSGQYQQMIRKYVAE